MREHIKSIIMMLFAALIISSTANAATVTNDELIMSQYGRLADTLNIGERLHLYTYSDGTHILKLIRPSDTAKPAAITDIQHSYTMKSGETTARLYIYLAPTYLDGRDGHDHTIEIKDSNGNIIFSEPYYISSDSSGRTNFEITPPATPGTYKYNVREYVTLFSPTTGNPIIATGTGVSISIIVPGTVPTVTATATATAISTPPVVPGTITKPTIIPPDISRLISAIWQSIKGLFGLSIQGGSGVDILVNKPYTTTLSLTFNTPDKDYTDGKYQAVFAEWFIADSTMTVKQESGWVELTTPPYTASASFTQTTAGKAYLVGVVVRQDYTWDTTTQKWTAIETIETKEVQELNVKDTSPTAPTTTKPALAGLWGSILSFLKSLGLW